MLVPGYYKPGGKGRGTVGAGLRVSLAVKTAYNGGGDQQGNRGVSNRAPSDRGDGDDVSFRVACCDGGERECSIDLQSTGRFYLV